MASLGIFGLESETTIVIFEINTLEFIKNELLTIIVNFDKGSVFSKGPGSTFSEGLGPGPGPLYALHQVDLRILFDKFYLFTFLILNLVK